mmetsp:Transcript_16789/g.52474  ORF Transcript_16789/g.52474 Transcript_16789/m.52474 type:complete len:300 (-) Transcript_16789:429-1328(-)
MRSGRALLAFAALGATAETTCNDTCEFAKNGICNDARARDAEGLGPATEDDMFDYMSACAAGTDCSDCAPEVVIEDITAGVVVCDDTCWFANDGFCDDGRYGLTAFCQLGTDCGDCGPVINFNDDVADSEYYEYGEYYDDQLESYSYEYYYYPALAHYEYYYGYYDDQVGRVDSASTIRDADDAPFVAAREVLSEVAREYEAGEPTIDIEIIVEQDDEVEIVVNDDAFPEPRLGPATLLAVFLLGLAGGLAGFAAGAACRAGCDSRRSRGDVARRSAAYKQLAHRGSSRQPALATPLLV